MKKRRVATILTISIALVLIGSVTYAAGKKRNAKVEVQTPEALADEEALAAELLAATEDRNRAADIPVKNVAADRPVTKEGQGG